jgi:hypothetical protein
MSVAYGSVGDRSPRLTSSLQLDILLSRFLLICLRYTTRYTSSAGVQAAEVAIPEEEMEILAVVVLLEVM